MNNGGKETKRRHIWGDEFDMQELLDDIAAAEFLVAHNCFSGNERFVTSDGVVAFKDVVGQTVNVWNEAGWQPAVVKSYGRSPMLKITLVPYGRSRTSISREVTATPNHRWKVDRLFSSNRRGRFREEADGYITTEKLKVGDKIWAASPEVVIDTNSDGFRHGLIFADGAKVTDREAYQLRLCGSKERYKDSFPRYSYPPSAGGDPVVHYYKSTTDLKKVPTAGSDLSYVAAFIEAWQLLDGTDSGNGTSRTVTTFDKEAAMWLKDNAISAGYYCTGVSEHIQTTGYSSGSPYWMVILTKNKDMGWTVRSVEEVEEEEAYCVEVQGLDRFTLDHGIYTGNCKFEAQWLSRCGLDLHDLLIWDTMLGEWVTHGNVKVPFNLEATAQRHGIGGKLPMAALCLKMGIPTEDIPVSWLEPYCFQDVDLATQLYYKQMQIMEEKGLLHLMLVRCLTCAALADIEMAGCELDAERVNEEYERLTTELARLESELSIMAGGINLGSSKQLGEFLFDKLNFAIPKDFKGKPMLTAKGAYKTDKATISKLNARTAEQKKFLEAYVTYNQYSALLTKNVQFFKGVVDEYGSKFYGVFNQAVTGTHRLSSSGRKLLFTGSKKPSAAQLQNMPRQYKGMFTAHDPDYLVGESDGAQLEFRVAADLGHDEVALAEIIEGADIHSFTAKVMIDAGHPDFKGLTVKEGRQKAKAHTFAPLFGSTGKHPAEKEYVEFFTTKYAGISATQRGWCLDVLSKGWMSTPYGMRFYWPGTTMSKSGYIENSTAIKNYSVQSFATGEIIPIALVHFWHRTRGMPIHIFNTIHDSIVSRVRKDFVKKYEDISRQSFTYDVYSFLNDVYNYQFKVPLGIGLKVAKHWGEGDIEKSWDVFPDGREVYKEK